MVKGGNICLKAWRTDVIFLDFFGEGGDVQHVRCVSNVANATILEHDVDAIVLLAIHVLADSADMKEVFGLFSCYR